MTKEYTLVNFIDDHLLGFIVGTLILEGTLDGYTCVARRKRLGIEQPPGTTCFKIAHTKEQDPRVCNADYLNVLEQHKDRLLDWEACEALNDALKATVPPDLWQGA